DSDDLSHDDVAGDHSAAGLKRDDRDALIGPVRLDRDDIEGRTGFGHERDGQRDEQSRDKQASSHDALDTENDVMFRVRSTDYSLRSTEDRRPETEDAS